MKKVSTPALVLALLISTVGVAEAAPKVGGSCTKVNSLTHIAGKTYVCAVVGKKKIWSLQRVPKPPVAPNPSSPSGAPTPTPTATIPDPILTAPSLFADISSCKISSTLEGGNLGFPRNAQDIPTTGTHRGIVIFVDYNDAKGDASLFDEWRLHQIPTMEKTFSTMSYGKLTYTIDLIPQIFHVNKDSVSYLLNTPHDEPANPKASPSTLISDAMTAADPTLDFSKYDYVNVVTPTTPNILYEGATGVGATFDGKTFYRGTFGTEREYLNQEQKANWLVHETGHLMGLIHNYDTADSNGAMKSVGAQLPAWDAMTYPLTVAPDFFGWTKFLLGWISDNQVDCLNAPISTSSTHFITPIGDPSDKAKIIVTKIDADNVIVIESRRKSSLDALQSGQEGIIVYKVNMKTESGKGAVELLFNNANVGTFPGDPAKSVAGATFQAAYGNLKPGEVLKTHGLLITYVKRAATGDFVTITHE